MTGISSPPTSPPPFEPDALARFLASTRFAPSQQHASLVLSPLVAAGAGAGEAAGTRAAEAPARYLLLDEAVARGTFGLEELGAGGRVGRVVADNLGALPVLVLFGQELRGAKQNRVANATFLVGARSRVELDVSCVEQGRWAHRSRRFTPSGEVFSSAARRKMAQSVARSMEAGAGFRADQGAVWDDVRERLDVSDTSSATASYADYLGKRAPDLAEAARAFHTVPGQVGFVAAMGGHVVGAEWMDHPAAFTASFPGLLRSYLVDTGGWDVANALDSPVSGGPTSRTAEDFLDALASCKGKAGPSLGLGEDVRFSGGGVEGCGLYDGGWVHVSAFAGAEW